MNFKRTLLVLALGAAACGATAAAASAEPLQRPAPREVMQRAHHQRQEVRAELRNGEISRAKAHRLLAADRRGVRETRADARMHGGRLTRAEHRHLNREENRIHRHIES